MSYPCIYNNFKECDGCQGCYNSRSVICPICGEELGYGDELYFNELNNDIIGCNNCVYTQYAEDYECD